MLGWSGHDKRELEVETRDKERDGDFPAPWVLSLRLPMYNAVLGILLSS